MSGYLDFNITPSAIPSTGILYVDHQKNRRSGHLSHALAEYKKGHIISFYSNCSYNRNTNSPGHNGFGWIEYRRSADGGKTWDVDHILYENELNPVDLGYPATVELDDGTLLTVFYAHEDDGKSYNDPGQGPTVIWQQKWRIVK